MTYKNESEIKNERMIFMAIGRLKNLAQRAKRVVFTGKFTGKERLGSRKLGYIKDWTEKNLNPCKESLEEFNEDIEKGKFVKIKNNSRIKDHLRILDAFIEAVDKLSERTTFDEMTKMFCEIKTEINQFSSLGGNGYDRIMSGLERLLVEQPSRLTLHLESLLKKPCSIMKQFIDEKNMSEEAKDSKGSEKSTGITAKKDRLKKLNEQFEKWIIDAKMSINELESDLLGYELCFDKLKNFRTLWKSGELSKNKKECIKNAIKECKNFTKKLQSTMMKFNQSINFTRDKSQSAQEVFNILDEI